MKNLFIGVGLLSILLTTAGCKKKSPPPQAKNFHWHMSGPHFLRDYHLLLDEQAKQIFDMTDDIAERVRKVGGQTLKSIGQISQG